MPHLSPLDPEDSPVIHRWHTADNDGIRAVCGYVWKFGEPRRSWATQIEAVTCEECRKTLKAAGMGIAG